MAHLRCGVVVCALNEEKVIGKCLESLRSRTVEIFLVAVNDGSVDGTGEIASRYADVVVNLPAHKENWIGRPELARVFNAGFDVLRDKNVEYILISGADDVYPVDYIEEITSRMKARGIVLASGIAEGEIFRSLSPRGGGRVVDAKWFRNIGFKYPENYGFEVYIVYKALSQGRRVAVFPDLKFGISRRTYVSRRKSYLWGKGMKALNYWWLYAIGRSVAVGIKHPANGLAMFKGYFSSDSACYDDIKKFVHEFQKRMLIRRLKEIL